MAVGIILLCNTSLCFVSSLLMGRHSGSFAVGGSLVKQLGLPVVPERSGHWREPCGWTGSFLDSRGWEGPRMFSKGQTMLFCAVTSSSSLPISTKVYIWNIPCDTCMRFMIWFGMLGRGTSISKKGKLVKTRLYNKLADLKTNKGNHHRIKFRTANFILSSWGNSYKLL